MNVGKFICADSVFLNNFAPAGGVIFGLDNIPSTIIFNNVSFFNNSAGNFLVSILNTNLTLNHCNFKENVNNLFLLESSYMMFYQSSILNHTCINQEYGCLANEISGSELYVIDSIVNHILSLKEGLIYSFSCKFFAERSFFQNLDSNNGVGPFLLSYYSIVSSFATSFKNYDINCIYVNNGSLIITNNSFINDNQVFKDNSKSNYGTIYCDFCQDFSINQSIFSGNKNSIIGTIALFSSSNINYINNCIFTYNQAYDKGGALYLFNSKTLITNSIFNQNQADYGGSIYCESANKLNIAIMQNNTFNSNNAISEGGAIKWNFEMPIIENNIFFNNSALYGNDIAAYPIRMTVNLKSDNGSYILSSFGSQIPIINNVTSGNYFPYNISIGLLDHYGQIVKSLDYNRYLIFHLFYLCIKINLEKY